MIHKTLLILIALALYSGLLTGCAPERSSEAPPGDLPDLVVVSAQNTLYPMCMGQCTQLSITVGIVNQGTADAPPFVVLINGVRVASETGLPAGEAMRLIAPVPGGHLAGFIEVVVDPDNAVQESDERNNTTQHLPMTLTPPGPCTRGECDAENSP